MGLFHQWVADNRNPASLASALRRKRLRVFEAFVRDLPRPVRILDVGGTVKFWRQAAMSDRYRITLLNRTHLVVPPNTKLVAVVGDARDLSEFTDGSFHVVFSNSVIEHLGTYESQRQMASEVRRVGVHYWVQTPNRSFPIEPHFLMPMFQFFPLWLQVEMVRRMRMGWYPRIADREHAKQLVSEHRLLNGAEMRALFPDAAIQRERFVGVTKSLIAMR